MEFGGSSLAENFSSEIEWIIHTLPFSNSNSTSNSSEIKCSVKTEYKGYMFKGKNKKRKIYDFDNNKTNDLFI